jgi:hypothetical protein
MRAVEALQLDIPALEERDSRVADEIVDEARDEHLTAERIARDPRGVVDRGPEETIGLLQDVGPWTRCWSPIRATANCIARPCGWARPRVKALRAIALSCCTMSRTAVTHDP